MEGEDLDAEARTWSDRVSGEIDAIERQVELLNMRLEALRHTRDEIEGVLDLRDPDSVPCGPDAVEWAALAYIRRTGEFPTIADILAELSRREWMPHVLNAKGAVRTAIKRLTEANRDWSFGGGRLQYHPRAGRDDSARRQGTGPA